MGIEKTIEIKAIDKEKALKRALNILGVELNLLKMKLLK